jgi:Bacteriophage baseplate protein W
VSSLAHLGRGWRFPVAVDPLARGLALTDGPEKVRQSLRIILDTAPGERIMRPGFGCGLRRYLGQPNSVAVRALIRHDVERAVAACEPRVTVTAVDVSPGDDPALVTITVSYQHVRTGSPDNLVFPFSLV